MRATSFRIVKYIVIIAVMGLMLDTFLQHQILHRYKNNQILSVSLQSAAIRAHLEKEVNGNLLLVQGLADYISLHPLLQESEFSLYTQGMLRRSGLIKSIVAAPDYIVRYVYPLKGNEAVMGMDYRLIPDHWKQSKLAKESGKMVFAGPVDLVQGGKAFIARVPVFIRSNEYFWGIVSAVIDVDKLLEKAGLLQIRSIRLAIRGVDGKGDHGAVFYGDPDLFSPERNAVFMNVSLSSGGWQIAAVPKSGWGNNPPYSMLVHLLIILLVFGVSYAVYNIVFKNAEVERVKASLIEAQSIAHLGNWDRDLVNNTTWWSSETYKLFGVSRENYIPSMKSFLELVHPDDRPKVIKEYTDCMLNHKPYSFDHRIVRPDGEIRYVSEQGKFEYDETGKPVRSYGTLLDITDRKLVENELRESKIRFDHITNRLSNKFIFFTHTIYGEFISLSKGFEMFGLGSPESGLGSRWTDIVTLKPESIAYAMEQNAKVISGECDTIEYEVAYTHSDGSDHFLAIFAYTTFNYEQGEEVFEGVAVDITERRAREEKLKVLTRAIENAPVSVVITDTEGTINYVNPFFTVETGYTREEAVGQNPRILKSGEHEDSFYKKMWETIISGETWRGEMINKKKDGTFFWESVSISPVYNEKGEIVSFVAVKDNIDGVKELERLKGDVDLIMRHDLKTPLNGIIGLPGLLLMDENLTADQRDLLKVIENSGTNMLHMIDMSLDMFKMETGKYEYYPRQVDVLSVVRNVITHSSSKLSARKVGVEVFIDGDCVKDDSNLILWGEERLLYSLISGLLANAVEASPQGENVSIKFTDSDPVDITICNKGAVPHNVRDRFFNKYVTEGKESGTGLGTYSAKLMAEAMRYDIRMETSDSKNETCIKILIPSENPE
ncbi:PAS domain S-box protein [Maridesulfovibrio hydrothermalis]|uniref:histidine kinase n=1 Tax=Maridesulfovibrio hydrothermalis AM13 = DSM 14728 TaxID=1121451 RepID=L0RBX5_9BACT|nr:PAS domain S-box protein [Maridesulfovibrio hydrothermalis]CCO23051.1 PAS/PAC sensor signal transduction histidine kinase [Maridesulfovibrio hydrothermalis AM13 = DSM 14728]